jgi:hypothetical protein
MSEADTLPSAPQSSAGLPGAPDGMVVGAASRDAYRYDLRPALEWGG